VNTEALEVFAGDRKGKPVKQSWRSPEPDDFVLSNGVTRFVVAVDQSLSGCAAVLLSAGRIEPARPLCLIVHASQKFATTPVEAGGYEETLRRATELHGLFGNWMLQSVLMLVSGFGLEIVHEQPPIGGGRVVRPESSLLASMAVRLVADRHALPVARMVAPQSHKHFICGDRKADKKTHHAALKKVVADLGVRGMDIVTNEDLRDALSIGLLHLTREERS
jgi:hypothetical protein